MMKIVVAYDGSDCSEIALADLARAGLPEEGEATVVSVADVVLPAGHAWEDEESRKNAPEAVRRAWEYHQKMLEEARQTAETGAGRLRQHLPGWKVKAVGLGDSPAWGVLNQALESGADLIVAGSHGKGKLRGLFLGSVSHKLLSEAPCSVRIVRESQPAVPPVVALAIDGSPASAEIVAAIKARHWTPETQFVILTVVDSQVMSAALAGPFGGVWVAPEDREAREAATRLGEGFAQDLRDAGLQVEVRVLEGDPKEVLVRETERLRASSLFMGARGLQHGERRAIGTVAAAIATRAHCPVEVVRRKE